MASCRLSPVLRVSRRSVHCRRAESYRARRRRAGQSSASTNRTGTGDRGQDYTVTPQADGRLRFDSTRMLRPGEGLTVAVSWPLGFVKRPSTPETVIYFLSDNSVLVAGVIGLGMLLAYYLFVWIKAGRDPAQGTIVARYAPPEGFSPAGSRYVTKMGFDDTVFTAAIVSMAVKGFLTIKQGLDKVFTLEKTGQAARLSPGGFDDKSGSLGACSAKPPRVAWRSK